MIPFRSADIEELVASLSKECSCNSTEVDGNQAFSFAYGEKVAEFRLPLYAPEEIWIALFSSTANFEAGTADFVMFEEPATEVRKKEILRHLEAVAWKYLKAPTRLRRRWVVFGARFLQYYHERQWKDIYAYD